MGLEEVERVEDAYADNRIAGWRQGDDDLGARCYGMCLDWIQRIINRKLTPLDERRFSAFATLSEERENKGPADAIERQRYLQTAHHNCRKVTGPEVANWLRESDVDAAEVAAAFMHAKDHPMKGPMLGYYLLPFAHARFMSAMERERPKFPLLKTQVEKAVFEPPEADGTPSPPVSGDWVWDRCVASNLEQMKPGECAILGFGPSNMGPKSMGHSVAFHTPSGGRDGPYYYLEPNSGEYMFATSWSLRSFFKDFWNADDATQEYNWAQWQSYTGRPRWLPDEHEPECKGCRARFSFIKRRHHCRRCGRIFCDNCTRARRDVNNPATRPGSMEQSSAGHARVCLRCDAIERTG